MSEHPNHSAPAEARRGAAENFTGVAFATLVVASGGPTDCVVGDVTFEPGARNHWHSHPAGQILVVTNGAGYYQEKGQPARLLRPGDAVSIAPGVVHWHGATATSLFTHYAINPNASWGLADWGAPVTDEEYQAAHA
ncbi:cupin domain-containing protein [Hymenobacter ruricola]|uniref:Cupin domain-containing protein n=1 Tax=Hymenobacter ruricola TaxID=2791023 RepID=A0ABS0I234_9BACT|nr:cupin domain-containing protein [Hymenobacter ruricola]MBF9220634.1 cupin domain-containing protein [Hymenobacter ruricola]